MRRRQQTGPYDAARSFGTLRQQAAVQQDWLRELWGAAQWQVLADVVRARDPAAMAVDISQAHNFANGLAAGEWEQMRSALGPALEARIVRRPRLAIDYLARRVPSMTQVYRRMQGLVHEITADGQMRWMLRRQSELHLVR